MCVFSVGILSLNRAISHCQIAGADNVGHCQLAGGLGLASLPPHIWRLPDGWRAAKLWASAKDRAAVMYLAQSVARYLARLRNEVYISAAGINVGNHSVPGQPHGNIS